jgi:hypothetical protein
MSEGPFGRCAHGLADAHGGPVGLGDTIVGNRAPSGYGGGIFCYVLGGTPAITNCIVWGNSDNLHNCTAAYSDVSIDPGFVGAPDGDYHLAAGSPCIDDATSTAAPATDKDGIARPWGAGYDIGAYEYYVPLFHPITSLSGSSSAKVNKTFTLSGTVSPTAASPYAAPGTVAITKTRKVGKVWKSAGSAKITLSGGKYSYSFKPTAKGSWRFTVTYSGGVVGPTTYLPSASGVKGVTVKWHVLGCGGIPMRLARADQAALTGDS